MMRAGVVPKLCVEEVNLQTVNCLSIVSHVLFKLKYIYVYIAMHYISYIDLGSPGKGNNLYLPSAPIYS